MPPTARACDYRLFDFTMSRDLNVLAKYREDHLDPDVHVAFPTFGWTREEVEDVEARDLAGTLGIADEL